LPAKISKSELNFSPPQAFSDVLDEMRLRAEMS